ncbi:hypothetical protein ATL41_1709 [Flavimobilis soli]|uniref:Uncharacterized protein n=1 Tax=Flavimobilis soli TaxID=442709 RepID=A0A2A9EEB1_9MICO|nr:hypothetical protein ATL41_1709 [Flavimobilis soli]
MSTFTRCAVAPDLHKHQDFVTFWGVKLNPVSSLVLTAALVASLAACSSDTPEPAAAATTSSAATPSDATGTTEPAPTTTEPAEPAVQVPESCADVSTQKDATVSGKALGTCIVDAMTAVGTGSMVVEDGTSSSNVAFRFDPKYSAYVTGGAEGELGVILEEKTGWLRQGAEWVEEGSGDQLVDATIGLVRVFSDPLAIKTYLATCDTWTTDGLRTGEARYDCTDTFEFAGATMSDVWFTVDEDFLGVESVATASMGGESVTTTQTFYRWGEPVDIPDPR